MLHFQAANTDQVTHVRIRRATFYNAGLYVTPVVTADARDHDRQHGRRGPGAAGGARPQARRRA